MNKENKERKQKGLANELKADLKGAAMQTEEAQTYTQADMDEMEALGETLRKQTPKKLTINRPNLNLNLGLAFGPPCCFDPLRGRVRVRGRVSLNSDLRVVAILPQYHLGALCIRRSDYVLGFG